MVSDQWPLEIDGREYEPVPESWIADGKDVSGAGPQALAVTYAVVGRTILVRYAHPRHDTVGRVRYNAVEGQNGLVPSKVADEYDSFYRSIAASQLVEPVDRLRKPESDLVDDLWAEYYGDVFDVEKPLVTDGGEQSGGRK